MLEPAVPGHLRQLEPEPNLEANWRMNRNQPTEGGRGKALHAVRGVSQQLRWLVGEEGDREAVVWGSTHRTLDKASED